MSLGDPLRRPVDRRTFLWRSAGSVAAVSSLGGVLVACGNDDGDSNGAAQKTAKPPTSPVGTMRFASAQYPTSFDPAYTITIPAIVVLDAMYESLVTLDKSGKPAPLLATSWEQNDDATEWEIQLNTKAVFHDGEPFDAAAVKTTLEYMKETQAKHAGTTGGLLPVFRKIDASKGTSIHIVAAAPFPDFVRQSSLVKMISPKLIAEGRKTVGARPSGTGPYKFVSRSRARNVIVEAFDQYWGAGPYFQRFNFPIIPDATSRLNALRANDVDYVPGIAPQEKRQFESLAGIKLGGAPAAQSLSETHFRVTTTNPAVKDPRVRQAIMYALDRQGIARGVLRDTAAVSQSVLPPAAYGYVQPETVYNHDPDRARSLLREAGITSGHKLSISTLTSFLPLGQETGEVVAQQLREAGFDVTLDIQELAVRDAEATGKGRKHDLYYDLHTYLGGGPFLLNLSIPQFFTGYNPPALQKLSAKLQTTPEGPERLQVLADIQNIFARDLPYLPMFVFQATNAMRSNVFGEVVTPDGITHVSDLFKA